MTRAGMIGRSARPWPALLVVVVLFGGALLGAARTSVAPVLGGPVTLDAWRRVLSDERFAAAAGFTVALAVVTTVAAIALALPLAWLVRRRRHRRLAITLPVLAPHLLVATLVVLWLGPGGLADRLVDGLPVLVRDRLGVGIVVTYLVKEVPFLALLAWTVWDERVDARVEMAATLGLGPLGRVRHVVWPATRAPLLLGGSLVAAFVLGSLPVPLLVGPTSPPTLPVHALQATRIDGVTGRADAAVVLLLTAAAATVVAALVGLVVRRLDGARP